MKNSKCKNQNDIYVILNPGLSPGQAYFRISVSTKMKKNYHVYIITNKNNTTFYIGMTNNLIRRIYEHKNDFIQGFSRKYKLYKLVYIEFCNDVEVAIAREKRLKNWHRDWKINLIKKNNPEFKDLYPEVIN